MENASKALIIAGGMLIAILIVSLALFTWNKIAEYKSSKDDLANIQDTAKFNEQFTQYERDDILGYDLLSLINRVIDYNERKTTDSKNIGNDEYKSIKLTINMKDSNTRKAKLAYGDEELQLFTANQYAVDDEKSELSAANRTNAKSSFENSILNQLEQQRENQLKCSDTACNNIARDISSIFMTEEQIRETAISKYRLSKYTDAELIAKINLVKQQMVEKYNSYANREVVLNVSDLVIVENPSNSQNLKYKAACMYYEYMQFKKAIFKCTNIEFDTQSTGRVNAMSFEFTGNIH